MSTLSNPQPEPTASDELVAYLDGELPPAECRRVEDRLASDANYRQQLRELDQAWEALNTLPTTSVDDGFARTTIELACVAAQEDLSHQSARASAETRSHIRWWLPAGVAAALIGFFTIRMLLINREKALLADLPVIEQVDVLPHVENIAFLRQLSAAVPVDQLVKDEAAYDRDLAAFKSASSSSPDVRREWIKSLSADQKADLATRRREFGNLHHVPGETDRLRKLTDDMAHAPDAPKLQNTLVAYGQWLSRHTAGEQEQLRDQIRGLSTNEQVDLIQRLVRREDERASRHLSADDAKILREEIFKFADEKKPEFMARLSRGRDDNRKPNVERNNASQALFIVHAALRNENTDEETARRLINNLSPEVKAHWERMGTGGWRREQRKLQLLQWAHDALQPKFGPKELETFFASDKLTNDERQRLLDMEHPKMEAELDRLYLESELGIPDRGPWLREFNEPGRIPRNGLSPGPPGRPDWRREGPPPDRRGEPGGPPPRDRFDRPAGPDGRRGPRPEDGPDGGRPQFRPRRPPPDGPPPNGPPPPPREERREAI